MRAPPPHNAEEPAPRAAHHRGDGLLLAVGVQFGVAVAVDQGKRIFLAGGSGFAVTHQNDFGSAFWRLIRMLSKQLIKVKKDYRYV